MNRSDVLKEFAANSAFREKWQSLIDDGTIETMLRYAECSRYPFTPSAVENENSHIQDRRAGGQSAWDKLSYLLLSMPNDEQYLKVSDVEDDDYAFVKDRRVTRAQAEFHKRR